VQWYDHLLSPLIWGVSWIIVQFHKVFSQVFAADSGWAWGLSIVFMTLVIRAALIPLFVKQIKSMRAMQVVQPEMKKLQDKYKKELERAKLDPVRKREIQGRQQREMMALYKEHGTNPFASCLPLLVQMPFFTALYRLLYNVANSVTISFMTAALVKSANKAHIFGAPISAHFNTTAAKLFNADNPLVHTTVLNVRLVIIVMTIVYVATQFITQRQMILKNSAPDNPMVQQQKMMMYIMPVFMAFFCFIAPVGVLIYLLTTNFWTMGQQFYVLHNSPLPGSKAHEAHLARQAAKAAKKAERKAGPVQDEVPAAAAVDGTGVNGTAAKAGGAKKAAGSAAKATGVKEIEDARPKPQRNQPVRTSRSARKK
jgi:YidC/Oxa1 family membrane protein insertase